MLLFVGRLTPIKGLETLLRALAALRSDGLAAARLTLLVVGGTKGDSGDGAHLRRLAQDLGVAPWVDFRGPQPQDALPDYYAAADLCLMPSRYESFGMVALEAMASGVPVIASRAGGLAVTVQDGVTGRLVPEGDVAALARAITGLLADDAGRRALGAPRGGVGPPVRLALRRAEPRGALRGARCRRARRRGRRLPLPLPAVAPAGSPGRRPARRRPVV